MRNLVLTLLLAGVGANSVLADDAPPSNTAPQAGDTAARPESETVPARQPTLPVEGTMLRVELKSGAVFKGVRRGPLYVKFVDHQYIETEADDYHAGIRIYFPRLQNGVLTVDMTLVKTVEELGELSPTEGAHIAKAIDDARTRADEDRQRLLEQQQHDLIEAEKARLMAEAAKPVEISAESLARTARIAELTALLTRFPPETWSLDTPDKIAHRRVVLGIQPTDEDMVFLRSFEDWKEGFALWQTSQAAAAKARKEVAEEAAADAAAKARTDAEAKVREEQAKREASRSGRRGRNGSNR